MKSVLWLTTWLMLSLAAPAFGATVEYLHTDALGSVVAVSNSAGTVIERREYEPYGRQLKPTVPADGPAYTGHVSDAATGLSYMQQRYYDPFLGRFLSVDPVTAEGGTGANFNRYWYANNNPYRFTDPDGRFGRDDCLGSFCERYQEMGSECKTICVGRESSGEKGSRSPEEEDYYAERAKMGERAEQTFKEAGKYASLFAIREFGFGLVGKLGRLLRIGSRADDVPRSASGLIRWSESKGFKRTQAVGGPIKYVDGKGVVRVTIKRGSARAPGSGTPHVELRNASGQRIDPAGNPVARRSADNHTPINWDLD